MLTLQEFLTRAKLKHDDKYDYSKIHYLYEKDKIPIICKKHGIEFLQDVHKHLAGQGCRKCSSEANGNRCRTSESDFIKKARAIHGNKYNYEEIEYKNNHTNIKINCPMHGDFYQTPGNHTHKAHPQGCPKCGGRTNWTKEKFINEASKVHKGKYGYDKVDFINSITKVQIICPEHGEFSQTPNKHLSGQKCPKCVHNFKGTTESFIKKAIEIHGNKYNYEKVKYVSSHKKVLITCPTHGDFKQTPASHTYKSNPQGCPKCSGCFPLNTNDFILRANEQHDFFYDYSKSTYHSMISKVKIVCPYHGEFKQRASVHLKGSGCQKCRLSKGEQKIQKVLKDLKLRFKREYSFSDCIYKNPLPFDFLVAIKNKKFLIEFNGEQHYQTIKWGRNDNKSEQRFSEIQKKDKIKKDYTEDKNIPLLIIKYNEIDMINKMINDFRNKII